MKIYNDRIHIYGENFKVKLCTCAQSMALGTCTKFLLEILVSSTISAIHTFQENILKNSQNISETTQGAHCTKNVSVIIQILWKFNFTVIPFLAIVSQQIFPHTMELLWHVQNFVSISQNLDENKMMFPSNWNCDGNIISEIGSRIWIYKRHPISLLSSQHCGERWHIIGFLCILRTGGGMGSGKGIL